MLILIRLIDDGTGQMPQFTDGIPILNTKTAKEQYRVSADGTGQMPQFTDGIPILNTKTAKEQYRVSAVHYSANARDSDLGNQPITTVVIRKFRKVKLTMDDLVKTDTLTPKMARFLQLLGKADITMFCVGKTGSGKTTLLNWGWG